jgi:hypothetical protein
MCKMIYFRMSVGSVVDAIEVHCPIPNSRLGGVVPLRSFRQNEGMASVSGTGIAFIKKIERHPTVTDLCHSIQRQP